MRTSWVPTIGGLLTALIFITDYYFAGIGNWGALYVAVVLLSARSRLPWLPFVAAGICTLLLEAVRWNLPPTGLTDPSVDHGNNTLEFILIWATAIIVYRIAARREQLRELSEELKGSNRQRTDVLNLLLDVAVEVNLSENLEEGMHRVLGRVARFNGWCYGQAFVAREEGIGELLPAQAFFELEPDRFGVYRSRIQIAGPPEDSIAGKVFHTGQVEWTPLDEQALSAEKAVVPEDLGVVAAVAFPILSGNRTVGVLEFFSDKELHFDRDVMEAMSRIGIDLGRLAEREKANLELRESEKWFRSVFDDAPTAIAIGDREGRLLIGNSAFEDFLKLDTREFRGKRLIDFVHPGDVWKTVQSYSQCLNGELEVPPVELRIRRENGHIRWGALSLSQVSFTGGDPIFGILMIEDIHDRKKLERSIARLSFREQRKFGQELHDGLGQQLVGMAMLARSLHLSLEKRSLPESETSAKLVESFRDAEHLMRRLARGLNPVLPRAEGFMTALGEMVENASALSGLPIDFVYNETLALEDNQVATHLFFIAQEAINNAIKYSQANRIRVSLSVASDSLNLAIADDGVGLDGSHSDHEGLGMRNMKFRAGVIGANLSIESSPDGGTVINCHLNREHWILKENGS